MAKTKEAASGPTVALRTEKPDGTPLSTYQEKSARGLWVKRLREFDGKPLAELAASCEAKRPSYPAKGKYAKTGEPVSGWIAFFKSEGLVDYQD